MVFTQQMMHILNMCRQNHEKILIKGKNGLGQSFRVEGMIMDKLENGKPSVTQNSVSLSTTHVYEDSNGKRILYITFYTDDPILPNRLLIEKIIIPGKGATLYENANFEAEIYDRVQENREEYDVLSLTDDGEKLAGNIGKIVVYEGEKSVLLGVCVRKGKTCMITESPAQKNFKVTPVLTTIKILPIIYLANEIGREIVSLF